MGLELTKNQKTLVKGLSEEVQEKFSQMKEADQLQLLELAEKTATQSFKVETSEVEDTNVEGVILRAGYPGLTKGTKIVGKLVGTLPLISKTKKENWAEGKIEGTKVWMNYAYVLELADKSTVTVFHSPMLNKLKKIPTHAATPHAVKENPFVSIEYHGKISKEEAKRDFKFEVSQGDEVHAFRVGVGAGVAVNSFASGILNLLRNPADIVNAESSRDMEEDEKLIASWHAVQAVNARTALPQVTQ